MLQMKRTDMVALFSTVVDFERDIERIMHTGSSFRLDVANLHVLVQLEV